VRIREFLKAWDGRWGNRLARIGTMDEAYPPLAPLLVTRCNLEVHATPLKEA
jgi:hypothetical protein